MAHAQYRPVADAHGGPDVLSPLSPGTALMRIGAEDVTWAERVVDLLAQVDERGQSFPQQHPYIYHTLVITLSFMLVAVIRHIYRLRFT